MFEAISKGWLYSDYDFVGTGSQSVELGKVNDYWLEKYYLLVDSRRFNLSRKSYFSHEFIMLEDGLSFASASKNGFFNSSFDMTLDGFNYSFYKSTSLKTHFELFKNDKQPAIGTIIQKKLFSSTLVVDLPDCLRIEHQFFITWLAILLIHRSQNNND